MITVVGLGFVGLTTALGLSSYGYKVYGYDLDQGRLEMLRQGRIPFYELHLQEALNRYALANFILAADLAQAVKDSQVIFFCVGTPSRADGSADLKYLLRAVEDVMNAIPAGAYKVLVIKSTVPPLTALEKVKPLMERHGVQVGNDIGLANNPEFLREGSAWEDFVHPDRVVVGACDERSGQAVAGLYQSFLCPVHRVSLTSAEFVKYLSNTLLASMISFANEMSLMGDVLGDVDIPGVFRILHEDRRWQGAPANMASYVFPGCGFGGSCLPKDIRALYAQARDKGFDSTWIKAIMHVNDRMKEVVAGKIMQAVMPQDTIGILGLAFKPNTDDVRETPSKDIIKILLDKGYTRIVVYDPMAMANFAREYKFSITYANSLDDLCARAAVAVILTGWKEFADHQVQLKCRKVLDFRYIL